MKKLHSYSFLYLILIIGLISWPGCDDEEPPPPECDFQVPLLGFGEYCVPRFQDFTNLADPQNQTITDLPAGCAPNYDFSRIFVLEVPAGGNVFLHRYRDFPAEIYVEVFGTNCDAGDYVLIDCFNDDALVSVYDFDASGYTQVVVRAAAIPTGDYTPGQRPTDELNFAIFEDEPSVQIVNGSSTGSFSLDCEGRPNRIILSPGPDSDDVIGSAGRLGLPFQACNCDNNLVALELPNGVSLDKLKPKVTKAEVEQDTTTTSFDRFIEIPIINPSSFNLDPNDDLVVSNNGCLNYGDPTFTTGNGNLKVAIIDSGVDYLSHPIFTDLPDPNASGCIGDGPLGYDFVNGNSEPLDQIGHGTSVASAFLSNLNIRGNLALNHYKFFGPDGGSLFDALCATATAVNDGSHLLNLSWGFEAKNLPPALAYVLDETMTRGVTVVASAGNNGQNVLNMATGNQYFPAAAPVAGAYTNVVIVGSYEQNTSDVVSRIAFSNFSIATVDLAAIYATECLQVGGGTDFSAGTSISAPIVTRLLAELMLGLGINNEPQFIINMFKADSTLSDPTALPDFMDGRYLPLPDPTQGCGINTGG